MQRQLHQHPLCEVAYGWHKQRATGQAGVAHDFGNVLVLQAQCIELHGRRIASFVGFDHGAAPTGVATDGRQAHREIGGQQSRIYQWANQRNGARGIAAGIAHALCLHHRFALTGGQFGEAVDPARCGAVRSRCINDFGSNSAVSPRQIVNHRYGFNSGIIVQAQYDQIRFGHQGAFGIRVFAQGGVDADEFDLRHGLQAFADLESGGACFAVNKNFFHGFWRGLAPLFRGKFAPAANTSIPWGVWASRWL